MGWQRSIRWGWPAQGPRKSVSDSVGEVAALGDWRFGVVLPLLESHISLGQGAMQF